MFVTFERYLEGVLWGKRRSVSRCGKSIPHKEQLTSLIRHGIT